MIKKYYACTKCDCKCTIETHNEIDVNKLHFPCKSGEFKEISKNEYDLKVKESK
jgi:hypothetical protein